MFQIILIKTVSWLNKVDLKSWELFILLIWFLR